MDKMKARPKYNKYYKKYGIVVNYNGKELHLGTTSDNFGKLTTFDTKQDAVDYIKKRKRFILAKNVKDMDLGE